VYTGIAIQVLSEQFAIEMKKSVAYIGYCWFFTLPAFLSCIRSVDVDGQLGCC
jgi:hypothetical protein